MSARILQMFLVEDIFSSQLKEILQEKYLIGASTSLMEYNADTKFL